jgi:AbrB family looped-hinge helix DNA binding protein
MRVTVSSKGQIVIPAEVRRRYEIEPGDQLVVVDLAGQISLHPVPGDPVEAALGAFKAVPGLSSEEFLAERRRERDREDAKSRRWAERAGEAR